MTGWGRFAFWLIVGLVPLYLGASLWAASDLERSITNPDAFSILQEEISTLKWIGMGICTAMSGAIAVLWRALVAAQKQSQDDAATWRQELIALTKSTLEVQLQLKEAVGNLQERISGCPHREET